ncbi:MAG TPA: Holliday junction resolvase RuvX [Candidatus Paceibacterota bacterium]|nr:Holliday junction resolvase RuvX [Candidatus Paceibacterota bacterium]HRY76737.1 Holliday junction resolvase RuvX [Candidatus Paceibacterota bacterium]
MRFLGIDYGSKKIGLATAEGELKIAIPRPTFHYKDKEELFSYLKKFIKEEEINQVVVGLPISLSFQETQISQEVREFVDKLKKVISVPIDLENELLSTKEAESQKSVIFRKIKSRAPQKEVDLDSQAAAIILESYFHRKAAGFAN